MDGPVVSEKKVAADKRTPALHALERALFGVCDWSALLCRREGEGGLRKGKMAAKQSKQTENGCDALKTSTRMFAGARAL